MLDLRRTSTALTRAEKVAVCPVADVKAQARITHNDEDDLIAAYIETAYDFLSGPEGWLNGCCLLQETWEFYPGYDLGMYFEIPLRPLVSAGLTAFEVLGADGLTYGAVDTSVFFLRRTATMARVIRAGAYLWPYASLGAENPLAYRVTFTSGFTPKVSPTGVPSPIVMGMKMLCAHWLRNRETVGKVEGEVLYGLRSLCGRYRVSPNHA
jgi:uncharacterized phiE125 gp8 family phage protein